MLFQRLHNIVDIGLSLVVGGFELRDALGGFAEETLEALLLLHVKVQALQLDHEVAEHAAHFAEILGAHRAKRRAGEIRDVLLGVAAVMHDLLGVHNVAFLRELAHCGLFGGGETVKLQLLGDDFFFFFLFLGCLFHGGSRLGGHGIEGQGGDAALFVHGVLPFCQISKSLPPERPSLASIVFITSMSVSISSAWFSNRESRRFL